jgi:hypothetical protein
LLSIFLYPGRLKDEIIDFDQHSFGYRIKILRKLKSPNPYTVFNVDKQTILGQLSFTVIESKCRQARIAVNALRIIQCGYYPSRFLKGKLDLIDALFILSKT